MHATSPIEVVVWLRRNAQKFAMVADTIEQAFQHNCQIPDLACTSDADLGERIKVLLADGKPRRPREIAHALGVWEDEVHGIVSSAKCLRRNERGWISLVADNLNQACPA